MWYVRRAGARSRSGPIGAVVAVTAAAALFAGCGSGTISPRPPGTSASPAPAARPSRPPAGSRAQALGLARRMLRSLVLPAGSHPVRVRPLPEQLRQPYSGPGSGTLVDAHRLVKLDRPMGAAARFLTAWPPQGMTVTTPSAPAGSPGQPARALTYTRGVFPAGIYAAEVDLMVIPAAGGGSLLRADAQVIWFLTRNAAEYLNPADYRAVTVKAITVETPIRPTVTRQITSRQVIARLAGLLNGLPAAPLVAWSCPVFSRIYRVGFEATPGARPGVMVTASGCPTDQVSVAGGAQPPLLDAGHGLAAMLQQLTGVKQVP